MVVRLFVIPANAGIQGPGVSATVPKSCHRAGPGPPLSRLSGNLPDRLIRRPLESGDPGAGDEIPGFPLSRERRIRESEPHFYSLFRGVTNNRPIVIHAI